MSVKDYLEEEKKKEKKSDSNVFGKDIRKMNIVHEHAYICDSTLYIYFHDHVHKSLYLQADCIHSVYFYKLLSLSLYLPF